MNKKIWSFVLATILSISLGSGSLSYGADPYAKTGGVNNNQLSSTSGSSYTVTPTPEESAVIGNTESKICAVFNYKSGVLLSVMDQDRNVTIYDAGKPRATLGYNDDGTFTVTNFYLSGSDWSTIEKMSGSTDTEKLKNFLLALGVDESALKKTGTDANGNVENGANTTSFVQEFVEWLDDAITALKKGINYSVAINLTASYGASMTWSVNGKAQETIGYDGQVLETYNYNAAGFLESITQNTYKVKEGSLTDGVEFEKTTNTVYLDAYGRQSYAVNASGDKVATYTYSSNGSLVSSYSTENKSTTYYSGGKASYVMNDQGAITTKYDYHANGSLNGITSFNYDSDTSALTKTTIEAYKWGRSVGTADLSSGTGVQTYDELRTAVAEIKANPNAALASLKSGASSGGTNSSKYSNITSISIYESDLTGANASALMNFLGIDNATKNKMLAMSNGYSAVASVAFTIDAIEPGTKTVDGGTKVQGGSFAAYTTSEVTSEGSEGEQLSCKVTVMDRGGASYQFNGATHTLRAAVDAVVKVTTVKDPVVEGTLVGVQTIDGVTYAVVSAANVNIMDGTGFQAADGETVMVQVDAEMAETLKAMLNKGETDVMFMGDVKADVNGHLTMAVNTNYSGGFASGAEIADLKTAIQNEELGWVKENTAANTAIFNNNGIRVQWQSGWNMLTGKQQVLRERTDASGNVEALF